MSLSIFQSPYSSIAGSASGVREKGFSGKGSGEKTGHEATQEPTSVVGDKGGLGQRAVIVYTVSH